MGKDLSKVDYIFQFCDGGSCRKAGSELAIRDARAYLKNKGLWNSVHTMKTRCNGRCEDAPTWVVFPGNYWYKNLTPQRGIEILKSHIREQKPLEDYLLYQPDWSSVKSEKERIKEAVSFKMATDMQLGAILTARMPSSEQELYPLLKFCFERYPQMLVQLPGQAPFSLNQAPAIDYTDAFDIRISSSEINIKLAIAPLPPDVSAELVERKVSVTEVIQLLPNPAEATNAVMPEEPHAEDILRQGLRLRNKWGKDLLSIWFRKEDGEIWQHILHNFLNINPQAQLTEALRR